MSRKLKWLASRYNISTTLPLSPADMTNVVTALCDSGLRAASIRTYMGRVSTLHELQHLQPPEMPPLALRMIQGLSHSEPPKRRRLKISPPTMLTIKRLLRKSKWSAKRKRVMWAASCLMFQ